MGTQDEAAQSHPGLRILRPLLWWLLLVFALYVIHLHDELSSRTHLTFQVTLAGQPVNDVTANFDGQPITSGQWIAIGSHRFTITQPNGDTYSTNLFFGWYGEHNLGTINLPRSHGTLSITANPPASEITITGPEFSQTLHNSSGTNITLPTDQYQVRASYPHWTQSQNIIVFDNQVSVWTFAPQFGALRLTCNHEGATYQLQSADGQTTDNGTMPATITALPIGSYQIMISYHHQQT